MDGMWDMDLSGARVLVTGGAGFMGSWLTRELIKMEADVVVFDDMSFGLEKNLEGLDPRLILGDVRDRLSVMEAVQDSDMVFHFAASACVKVSVEDPRSDFSRNVEGTFNLLECIRKADVDPVIIYASSAAVYGEPARVPIDEEHPLGPVSPYGISKLVGEEYVRLYNRMYGLRSVSLRFFNVYGPRQRRNVVYDFCRKLSRDATELEVLGTGEQVRDFVYVSDAVRAAVKAAQSPEAIGKAINVASGQPLRIIDLARKVMQLMALGSVRIRCSGYSWKGDVSILHANISAAERLLDWKPSVPLSSGLQRTLEFIRENDGEKTS